MKYLICNLKAHKTYPEIQNYINELQNIEIKNTNLIIAPSNIYLSLFRNINVNLCAQNIDLNENLNLTGDTTIAQLKSLNVNYVIIGHYERQKYYHETEHEIIAKIQNALKNNLKVIYCIGETYEEVARKVHYKVLERAIARILNNIPSNDFENIIIAYEPIYMIGSETNPSLNQISDNINFIKNLILNYYNKNIKLVYGGNVNPENISELIKIKNVDGFILGTSSLYPENIKKIIEKLDV